MNNLIAYLQNFENFLIVHSTFLNFLGKFVSIIITIIGVFIAFEGLRTWKKDLNFKKKVEVLDNLFNQCEKYISQHGYPNTESLYEIILNIKKEKIYFNANLLKDLENFINKLMEYHKILIQQKITKNNDIDFDKLITLPNEIRDLAICMQNIVLEKKYKLYDINFM